MNKEDLVPQNGIHASVGVAARKWMPNRERLLPDLDNITVQMRQTVETI